MNNLIKKIKEKGIIVSIIYCINTPIYICLKFIGNIFFKNCKIKNDYVMFTSSPDFSDNSKILYNYMKKNDKYKEYKYIWLVTRDFNLKENKEKNTVFVKCNSYFHCGKTLKALYYISRSKLVFFTHSSPFDTIAPKKNQLIINLWHGCGYKDIQKNDKSYIERYPFNYALVPGKIFKKTKSKFWGCEENKILDIGYPRYDLFFHDNSLAKNLSNKIKDGKKIIFWMPTFRKTKNNYYPEEFVKKEFDLPILESQENLDKLNKLCAENNIKLCIKRHPMQIKYSCETNQNSNIIFIDNDFLKNENVELYSLLKYSDGLITDYSSIAIDYLLLDKPIAFTLDDFNEYSSTRGFIFENPKKYMPGHHIYNYDDFINYIIDIANDKDAYKSDREKIMNEVHNKCDNYCERVINKVNELFGK